jgi:hypothetical protein
MPARPAGLGLDMLNHRRLCYIHPVKERERQRMREKDSYQMLNPSYVIKVVEKFKY